MNLEKVSHLNKYLSLLVDLKDMERIGRVADAIEKEFGINKEEIIKKASDCLIIGLIDISGSMGIFEKEAAKEYFELATQELAKKHPNIQKEFITFHTEAKLLKNGVDPFSQSAGGGTVASLSLVEAAELISKHQDKNIYVFLISDGDNLTSDNPRFKRCLIDEKLIEKINHFYYVEINQYNRISTLLQGKEGLRNTLSGSDKFSYKVLAKKDDALTGLRFLNYIED